MKKVNTNQTLMLCALLCVLMFVLGMLSPLALAQEAVAAEGLLLTLSELSPSPTLLAALYAAAHVVAILPPSFTARLPKWLQRLVNVMAANYGGSKNRGY